MSNSIGIIALWETLREKGFYISQRGEGKFWILHSPNGKHVCTAGTREDLLNELPKQFN